MCKQCQHEMGLETHRQLNRLPSHQEAQCALVCPITKMLKPTFDSNNFEELFSNWEFEPSRYERDNCTTLPGQIKIAVLMSATSGPPEQHLHLNAGATPTYVEVRKTIKEYYRATTALSRYTSSMDHQASQHIRKEDRHLWTAELSTKDRKKNAAKAKARSPTKATKAAKATKARDMAMSRVQHRERKDWTGHSIHRSSQQRRIHKQRKRQAYRQRKGSPNTRVLQMWPARSHSKRLQSGPTRPQQSHRQHLHQQLAGRPKASATAILRRPIVE